MPLSVFRFFAILFFIAAVLAAPHCQAKGAAHAKGFHVVKVKVIKIHPIKPAIHHTTKLSSRVESRLAKFFGIKSRKN